MPATRAASLLLVDLDKATVDCLSQSGSQIPHPQWQPSFESYCVDLQVQPSTGISSISGFFAHLIFLPAPHTLTACFMTCFNSLSSSSASLSSIPSGGSMITWAASGSSPSICNNSERCKSRAVVGALLGSGLGLHFIVG